MLKTYGLEAGHEHKFTGRARALGEQRTDY